MFLKMRLRNCARFYSACVGHRFGNGQMFANKLSLHDQRSTHSFCAPSIRNGPISFPSRMMTYESAPAALSHFNFARPADLTIGDFSDLLPCGPTATNAYSCAPEPSSLTSVGTFGAASGLV